jgi:hypothetical protein
LAAKPRRDLLRLGQLPLQAVLMQPPGSAKPGDQDGPKQIAQ